MFARGALRGAWVKVHFGLGLTGYLEWRRVVSFVSSYAGAPGTIPSVGIRARRILDAIPLRWGRPLASLLRALVEGEISRNWEKGLQHRKMMLRRDVG